MLVPDDKVLTFFIHLFYRNLRFSCARAMIGVFKILRGLFMKRRIIIIVASIVLVVSAAGILIAYFTGAIDRAMTSEMSAVGERYMRSMRSEDYGVIIELSTPDLINEIGPTGQVLQDNLNNNDLLPVSWEFTKREIVGTQGQMSGSVVFTRGRQGAVELSLVKIGREWKVSGFRLDEK